MKSTPDSLAGFDVRPALDVVCMARQYDKANLKVVLINALDWPS